MDVREKLIELLGNIYIPMIDGPDTTGEYRIPDKFKEKIAEHLVSNGVTVQEDCKECAEATQNCIVKLQQQIAELRSAQEWVSVKDRLPDVGFDVLFMCENKYCGVGIYSDTYRDFFSCQFPVKGVTHWMPMPQPPKGGLL